MFDTLDHKFFLFLFSGTIKFNETQKVQVHKYFYFNLADTFLDIPN